MKMDDTFNLIVVVHQTDASADGNISMVPRRRGQTTPQILRHRAHSFSQILVEHGTFPKTRLLIGVEPILVSESSRWMVLVPVVPISRSLTILIIKLRVISAILTAGAHDEECRRANVYENSISHEYLVPI